MMVDLVRFRYHGTVGPTLTRSVDGEPKRHEQRRKNFTIPPLISGMFREYI